MAKTIKLVKKKICAEGYLRGYWKGNLIALIPKYKPGVNPADYIIEEVEFPENMIIPKIIEPQDTDLSIIKEICEINNFSFRDVTGIDTSNRSTIKIDENDHVSKGFECFLIFCSSGTTTPQYRGIFKDLKREKIIDPKASVKLHLENADRIEAKALKLSPLDTDKHYNYNDKALNMLKSFHSFLKNSPLIPVKNKKTTKSYLSKKANHLTEKELNIFFSTLKDLDPTHELIAQVLYWCNREILNHPEVPNRRAAPNVHVEDVLRMQPWDIGFDSENLLSNASGNFISVYSHSLNVDKISGFCVPEEMYSALLKLAQDTDAFIFKSKAGKPISSRLLRKSFSEACKKANLRSISPSELR